MKLPKFEYAAPESLGQACRLLESRGEEAHPIAGGTDLLMALKNRQKFPKMLVDLGAVPNLSRIEYSDADGLRIGAMVSLRRLAANPIVREKYPILVQAALSVGTVQLQAMGTVGGNLCQDTCCMYFNRSAMVRQSLEPCHKLGGCICHVVSSSEECWAAYTGDLAPALLALGASVSMAGPGGEQRLPLQELFSGDGKRPIALRPGQLLAEIQVPAAPPRSGAVYLKLRQRETLDYPLLGVAVHLTLERGENGHCKTAALAMTAVDKAPILLQEAGKLAGRKLTEAQIRELARAAYKRAHPMKNLYGLTTKYRLSMVEVYVEMAVRQALESAIH
ncbi:MAG: FAD binding domain-containing protein [Acidobacteria bacterium]|nr:FAD binding domain-containing protein [Acidobacteriota bacterium]